MSIYTYRDIDDLDANSMRKLVFRVHGDECVYCGDKATDVEHMLPRCKDGTSDFINLVPSCNRCNSQKGTKTQDEYVRWILMRGINDIINKQFSIARQEIIKQIDKIMIDNFLSASFVNEGLSKAYKEKSDYFDSENEMKEKINEYIGTMKDAVSQ